MERKLKHGLSISRSQHRKLFNTNSSGGLRRDGTLGPPPPRGLLERFKKKNDSSTKKTSRIHSSSEGRKNSIEKLRHLVEKNRVNRIDGVYGETKKVKTCSCKKKSKKIKKKNNSCKKLKKNYGVERILPLSRTILHRYKKMCKK